MNRIVYMILLFTVVYHYENNAKEKHAWKQKIKSFFVRMPIEKIEQHELCADEIETITIINRGPVFVKSGPKKSLFFTAKKAAKKHSDLDDVAVVIDRSKNKQLIISSQYDNKKKPKCTVHCELIVPACCNIFVEGNDTVCIKDVLGTITAVTHGNITITNSKKSVLATALDQGSIIISHASGPVNAQADRGDIIGQEIAHSFSGHSIAGKINVAYKTLPSTSSIDLKTITKNILLELPTNTNAEILGSTINGSILSDHYLVLKPYTTQLNKSAWKKFKQTVNGTLGMGQAAIALQSTHGNIKITEKKIT